MSNLYILVGHEPVEEPDMFTWAYWFQTADRHVALTEQDDVRVSTVFLGLDHGWGGVPLLFETMVFRGTTTALGREVPAQSDGEDEFARYSTWDEAVAGHQRMVREVFKARPILALPTGAGDDRP
jgi:hypothetical protein